MFLNDQEKAFLPIRRSPTFVNPEVSQFAGVLFLSIRMGPRFFFHNKHVYRDHKTYVDERKMHGEYY